MGHTREIDVRAGPDGGSATNTAAPRASEGWRPLLDAVPAAVVIVGRDGAIRFTNRRLEVLTGYGRGELQDQPVEVLLPESLRAAHASVRAAYSS